MNTKNTSQLPIDECEEWIWDALDCTRDCGFEYINDGNKEFLIFNTNDFFADAKTLEKINKTTGMKLLQMSAHNGYTRLWFGRYRSEMGIQLMLIPVVFLLNLMRH